MKLVTGARISSRCERVLVCTTTTGILPTTEISREPFCSETIRTPHRSESLQFLQVSLRCRDMERYQLRAWLVRACSFLQYLHQ